jgi:glycosyltransferase involved in cell wall biosynthesis
MEINRRASIGIPVFQGENYLDWALKAARTQDYDDIEIVVSDNASTDGTRGIVERHAAEDHRVRALRQPSNIVAAENYNEVLRASSGAYFAWNAHDDFSSSSFISAGVAALESNPNAVVAIARSYWVDVDGTKLEEIPVPPGLDSPSPAQRFRSAARGAPAALVFGLYRRQLVEKSHLHQAFSGSDRNFVAEMMLFGRAVKAADAEFYMREHPDRSVRRLNLDESRRRFEHSRESWYSPERGGRIVFPAWRRLAGYATAIARAPIGTWERIRCSWSLIRLLFDDKAHLSRQLGTDIFYAGVSAMRMLRERAGPR